MTELPERLDPILDTLDGGTVPVDILPLAFASDVLEIVKNGIEDYIAQSKEIGITSAESLSAFTTILTYAHDAIEAKRKVESENWRALRALRSDMATAPVRGPLRRGEH